MFSEYTNKLHLEDRLWFQAIIDEDKVLLAGLALHASVDALDKSLPLYGNVHSHEMGFVASNLWIFKRSLIHHGQWRMIHLLREITYSVRRQMSHYIPSKTQKRPLYLVGIYKPDL